MADQGLWWKLWCSALDDPALDNLDVADFGRYCKLGAFIKRHGQAGTVSVRPPARALCATFQVLDFDALLHSFSRMPNVQISNVTSETNAIVTFVNWQRYQADYSGDRVRKFRRNVTLKKRREETKTKKRRDKKSTEGNAGVLTDAQFFESLRSNPAYQHIDMPAEVGRMEAWLALPAHRARKKTRRFVLAWLNRVERPLPPAAPPPTRTVNGELAGEPTRKIAELRELTDEEQQDSLRKIREITSRIGRPLA